MQLLDLNGFITRHTSTENEYRLQFEEVLQSLPGLDIGDGPWLAGGSIRRLCDGNHEESDYDIFFKDEQQEAIFRQRLVHALSATTVRDNELNTTYAVKIGNRQVTIQCIHVTYFRAAQDVLDWFDFTICQFLTDGKQGYYMCSGAMTEFLNQVINNPNVLNEDIVYVD